MKILILNNSNSEISYCYVPLPYFFYFFYFINCQVRRSNPQDIFWSIDLSIMDSRWFGFDHVFSVYYDNAADC